MRVVPVAVVLALVAGPVWAQGINLAPMDRQLTNEQIEKNKEIDQAYRESIKKIPDQKPNTDPWGNVRASTPSQPAAAAAHKAKPQKSSKTQSTAR